MGAFQSLPILIPFCKPRNTRPEVMDAIKEVLESGWLTTGPKNTEVLKKRLLSTSNVDTVL